jgi:SanA protein
MLKKITRMILILVRIVLISLFIAALTPFVLRAFSDLIARGRIYTADAVPDDRRVAIIFGAQVLPSGRLSAMLADRVKTGVDLYHAGKVDVLLLTGDNTAIEYNEPEAMRQYALAQGVPDEAIVLDYAGRRTYDSCYRAREIFHVSNAVLITQDFHLDRALLLCRALGVDAVGVAADYQRPWGYSRRSLRWSKSREIPATLLAVWDIITRPEPVLGDPLPIFESQSSSCVTSTNDRG